MSTALERKGGREGGGGVEALLGAVLGLYEGDVVPLDHDAPQRFPGVALQVDLVGIVQHQVHELVKSCNDALNTCVDVLVEPEANVCCFLLQ